MLDWLDTEGPRVRASPAWLRGGPWARHIYPSLVLVQPRKTRPYLTERLLMGRTESNQTNQKSGIYITYAAKIWVSTQNWNFASSNSMILSNKLIIQMLIRLCECACWFVHLLSANTKIGFLASRPTFCDTSEFIALTFSLIAHRWVRSGPTN